jgi:branched-chain amino acid transport system substrate-binding protein
VRQRYVKAAVPIMVGALVLAGCGSNKKKATSSGGSTHTATIGVIAPLTGPLSALGLGIKNSVDLAIKQANAAKKIPGWTIKFNPQDDTASADVGKRVASTLASDSSVVGVVGTLNSSVALQAAPVLQGASIVMISPANTNPSLTQGPNWVSGKKTRPYTNYFRVATTDAIQGPFAAHYLISQGIKRVAVVNDKKVYGQGLAGAFSTEFQKEGGTVLIHEVVADGQQDYSSVISAIKPKAPQAVYYGGEYPEASVISKQMKAAGLKVPLMGGDGIVDPTYVKVAGAAAEGDYATNVGGPPEKLATAAKFISDYNAAHYAEPFSAYGPEAYDAANVIINAMAKVLAGKTSIDTSVRKAIIDAVAATNIQGATGTISFDQYGDTTNKVITVYKVEKGTFTPLQTGTFSG